MKYDKSIPAENLARSVAFTPGFIEEQIEKERKSIVNCRHRFNYYLEALLYIRELQSDRDRWEQEIKSLERS